MSVQSLAGHASLDAAIEVIAADVNYGVHVREIEANAAMRRLDLPLQRCPYAIRDYRHAMVAAGCDNAFDIGSRININHGIGSHQVMHALTAAVCLADALRCIETFSEIGAQRG
jgi:hypothetical protein